MSLLFDSSDDSDDSDVDKTEINELVNRIYDEIISAKINYKKIDKRKGYPRLNLDHNGNKRSRPIYSESPFHKLYVQDRQRLLEPNSKESKLFRLRFRLSFPIFEEVLEWTKSWYIINDTDSGQRSSIPLVLKVLGVLRILGRSTCLDGIEELTGISKPSMSNFLHLWCLKCRELLFSEWIKLPGIDPEQVPFLDKIMKDFRSVGFPGT